MPKLTAAFVQSLLLCWLIAASAAQQQRATEAFNSYLASAEARITRAKGKSSSFLAMDSLPSAQHNQLMSQLRRGEVVIEKQGDTPADVPAGLIHDWVGTVFIPKVTVGQVLSLIQDYDHTTRHYSPDVEQSHLESRRGDDFRVFMRLRQHKVITVVLDTEYNVHYGQLDPNHQYSFSRSTRVTEVSDPGTTKEHELSAGKDHGFMWRLNSYWAFEETGDGVLIECEAISLTRDIPSGLGWMIGPFVNRIPRESLQFTLEATRKALATK